MARIQEQILRSVIYLYPSGQDAMAEESSGGTGFLVSVPFGGETTGHFIYAVTNSHVARARRLVARINTSESYDLVEFAEDEWAHHGDGDDVAVAGIAIKPGYEYARIPEELFVTRELIDQYAIGPGDDTFFVGRFAGHFSMAKDPCLLRRCRYSHFA